MIAVIGEYLGTYGLRSNRYQSTRQAYDLWHPSTVVGGDSELEQAAAWLAYLFHLFRNQDCVLKHDKIYSAVGIATSFSNRIALIVTPDYLMSATKV